MMKGFEGRHRRIHPAAAVIIALFAAGLVFAGYSIIHGLLQTRSETHQEALADCRSAQQRFSTTYTTYRATMSSAQRLAETGESDVANPASVSDLVGTIASMLKDTSADALSNRACDQRACEAAVILPFDCHFHDCVALTFDDGPNKQFTPQLLDALADAGVPATFFVQGQFVSGSNVDLVGWMAAEGHDVGSISWRHTQLHTLDAGTLAKWFKDTDEVISAASGRPVTLFRPPGGAWSDTVRDQAQASGESIILWNVDSGDWRGADAGTITTTVVDGAAPGSIVALHDGYRPTIEAIPGIVQGLRDKGLTPVTVTTLLGDDRQAGAVYYGLDDAA